MPQALPSSAQDCSATAQDRVVRNQAIGLDEAAAPCKAFDLLADGLADDHRRTEKRKVESGALCGVFWPLPRANRPKH